MNQPTPVRPTIHSTLNTRHAPAARFPICRLIALLWLGLWLVGSAHALNIVQYVEVSGVPGQDGVIRVTIGQNTLEVPIAKDATCEQICQAIKDKIAERDTPDFWKGLKIDCLCSAGSSLIGFRSGDGTDLGKPKIKTEGKDDLGNPTGGEIPGVSIDPTEIDNALIKISNITGPPIPLSGNGTNRWTNCIVVVINGLTNEICVVVDDDISGDDAGEYPSTADEIIAEFLKRIEAHPDLGAVRDAEGQVFVTLGGPSIKILRFGTAKFPYAGPDNQPYPEPLLRSVNPGTGGLEGTYLITLHCSSMGPNATVLFNGLPLPALAYDPELDTYTVQVPPSPFAGPVEIAVLPPGTDSNRHNTIKEGFVYQPSLLSHDFEARGLSLAPLGNGLYEATPRVEISMGSGATSPVPLDFVILVNGALRHDGRNTIAVQPTHSCPQECTGGCVGFVGSKQFEGNCQGGPPPGGCNCVATMSLDAIPMALSPGDVVQLVLDPDHRVIEFNEINNTFVIIAPVPLMPRHDFVAQELNLASLGNGIYGVRPQTGITVASGVTDSLTLDYQILVNGNLRYDGRGAETVTFRSFCEDEDNCSGGCWVAVNGQRREGTCHGSRGNCGCSVSSDLAALQFALLPGDIVQLVLDPDNRVAELDEANNTFGVTVPNHPPLLPTIPNQAVHAGTLIQFPVPANDPDGPAQTLTYSLEGAPDGASIDPVTGEFQWHPTAAHIGTSNLVVVRVTDNGQPPLSDFRDFFISVAPPPVILGSSMTNGALQLTWTSVPGNTYRIEATRDLSSGVWTEQVGNLSAQDTLASWSLPAANTIGYTFYRIALIAAANVPVLAAADALTNTPAWTCCERNIEFPKTVKITPSASTDLTNNNTRRFVIVDVKVPLEYRCADVDNQKCIADLAVKVVFRPRQADGTGEYTGDLEEEIVETIRQADPPDCDNEKHKTEIIIRWRGTYKTRRDIKGTLNLELSVPGAKGNINHTLSVDVASASSPKAENPVLKKRE